jgi:hypothetical protein
MKRRRFTRRTKRRIFGTGPDIITGSGSITQANTGNGDGIIIGIPTIATIIIGITRFTIMMKAITAAEKVTITREVAMKGTKTVVGVAGMVVEVMAAVVVGATAVAVAAGINNLGFSLSHSQISGVSENGVSYKISSEGNRAARFRRRSGNFYNGSERYFRRCASGIL